MNTVGEKRISTGEIVKVCHVNDQDNKPLCLVDYFLGTGAELYPEALFGLGMAFLRAAVDNFTSSKTARKFRLKFDYPVVNFDARTAKRIMKAIELETAKDPATPKTHGQ